MHPVPGVPGYRRNMDVEAPSWTPLPADACTLPTAEQPLREREFDDLFAAALRSVTRVSPTTVRMSLTPEPQIAARAADLAVRETGCCSFFTFTLEVTGDELNLDITVPPGRQAVLAALAARAEAVA
ncbi:hypothetical protein GCM10010492_52700 [Saccharothrix mutabilis subsp. mutabilis]|uniref:Arsenate reductase n=2 Tax=Saccharothrix mutabilis TaxID=33921 RepID=A0ABP3E1A1_9PSEU